MMCIEELCSGHSCRWNLSGQYGMRHNIVQAAEAIQIARVVDICCCVLERQCAVCRCWMNPSSLYEMRHSIVQAVSDYVDIEAEELVEVIVSSCNCAMHWQVSD